MGWHKELPEHFLGLFAVLSESEIALVSTEGLRNRMKTSSPKLEN